MTDRLGQHAVVVGGSIAGLMTARALADYFDRVTVFERDQIEDRPTIHKSIPQGNHTHGLSLGGQRVMAKFFPGFTEELKRSGAVPFRAGINLVFYGPNGKGYTPSGSVREPHDLGFEGHALSRALLEYLIRRRTAALANVKIETGWAIEGPVHDNGQIRGVRCVSTTGSQQVDADLVVDAGGRGSHAPRWLAQMRMPTPEETTIGVDFAYTSTKFRKTDQHVDPVTVVGGQAPITRLGVITEIEGDIWLASLGGRFGDYPATDEDGFLAFAKTLPSPILYDAVKDAERIADFSHHRFPTSVQRHYERLSAFPGNFLVVGDAVASFNPVYGQGMSSAARQAEALHQTLRERAAEAGELVGLSTAFFGKAAGIISAPWVLAAGADFAYAQTKGERPPNMAQSASYFAALDALQTEDVEVQRLMTEVFQLTKPLSVLSEEPLRSRVMARM
jgi:2-polyprenyl-6-methoxyphenol hydroxylase-like FAD-dependent oxidoreductase